MFSLKLHNQYANTNIMLTSQQWEFKLISCKCFVIMIVIMFRWNWIHKMMEPIIQAMIYLNEFDLWSPEFKHFMQSGTGIAKISSQPLNSFLYRCRNHPAKTNRSKALTLLKQKRRTLKKWARADEIYCIQDITNQECE
mmetsp:Transcript_15599/g.19554  ORF Transcript_15599/g.19554 Transcript_15599/m.19554 type:complete len:139 (-) Transcript_15599:63-479(-)